MMENGYIYLVGFLAQMLFSARLLLQWIKSERAGNSLSPTIFWQLSILASWMLFVYGLLRNDFAIILGQVLAYFIYIRNLQLKNHWQELPLAIRGGVLITPLIALFFMFRNWNVLSSQLFDYSQIPFLLIIWGVAGQVIFTFRFVYQWIYSEKRGESCLPLGFWIISVIGSAMILSYAIYRKDPVLFCGQGFGVFIYVRNILLVRRKTYQITT